MKTLITIFTILLCFTLSAQEIDEVRVYKSKRRMDLLSNSNVVKSYRVMLGRGGKGPKRKQGDNLVPEGRYTLDFKNPKSQFYKSIHVSYPNEDDVQRAHEAGVEPGGDIMIHGYPNRPKPFFKFLQKIGLIKRTNWTAGCMAVDDQEMDEIFKNIEVPIPITIFH
jgi:murein L,D-transpeptidase YafK